MTTRPYGIRKVTLSLLAGLWFGGMGSTASAGLFSQDFNNIEYLCCDWGPAMTLPGKTNEVALFNDAEDEVYFLKQVGSFTRKKSLLGGRDHEDIGHGISIYLCKMKPDGSGKTEIRELWRNPNYPIDTQAQSTWMNVNAKTRRIALAISYGGSDLTGLWTVNLDGSELRHLITPVIMNGHLRRIDGPSWTPDGEWIVFGEVTDRMRLMKCSKNGDNAARFMGDEAASQPCVSPDGKQIAYIHHEGWARRLYLVNIDGTNLHPLPNPDDKRWHTHGGTYPAWSPDGKLIFAVGAGIVDVTSGQQIKYRRPVVQNMPKLQGRNANVVMPHWGKLGLICGGWGGGIQLADETLEKLWIIATSDIEEAKK